MTRWAATVALLAALAPAAAAGDTSTTVRILKPAGPYRTGTATSRWTPLPAPRPMAPPLGRVVADDPAPAADPAEVASARARACKVFDRNANGMPDGGEPMVEGWRFRLTDGIQRARVRTTGWNGCAEFTGLAPGSYTLSEILPPTWDPASAVTVAVDVPDPATDPRVRSTFVAGDCVQFARLGSPEYWASPPGLRLLEDWDRHYLDSLAPFGFDASARTASAAPRDVGAWGPGTWQGALARYLTDRKVAADPRGRLAQEVLVFALNARHFLEGARVVLIDDRPVFVDDLLFEGILAWYGDSPGWNHEMTALLASLNGTQGLPYVPRDTCQVAYLPF